MTKEGEHVLEIAYPIAIGSYDTLEKRYSAVEKRLQELLTFGVAISLGFVTLFAGRGYSLQSRFFITGIITILIAVFAGVYARMIGHMVLISPTKFDSNFEELVQKSDFEIKQLVVKSAAKHWDKNNKMVTDKHKLTGRIMALFLLGFILLGCWVATGATSQSPQNPCPPPVQEQAPSQAPSQAPVLAPAVEQVH